MKNNKGSVSVFLVFILTAMIGLTAAFIYAAKQAAIVSYGDGILNLAGRTVLSEFNLELKDRYGLFAFEKSGEEVEAQVREDSEFALCSNADARLEAIKVSYGEGSLGETENFKKQILDYMKFAVAENMLKKEARQEPVSDKKERTLRNHMVIDNLPSASLKESGPGFVDRVTEFREKLGSVDQIFDQNKDAYLIDRYILLKFKNALGGQDDFDTFFENEVEYILEGDPSNKKNRAEVRKGFVLLRSSLNAVHLYTDSEKRAVTLAAAEALTPGAAAVLTQAVLVGTWALAEAENDAQLLDKGRPVALLKDKTTWATDLDSVLNNQNKGCIDTGTKKGLYYKDYLMIFLHFESEALKLTRAMDLIQINMKGTSQKDFFLKNCNCGFRLKAKINGKERGYDTRY